MRCRKYAIFPIPAKFLFCWFNCFRCPNRQILLINLEFYISSLLSLSSYNLSFPIFPPLFFFSLFFPLSTFFLEFRETASLSLSPPFDRSIMVVEKASMHSNLDCFLHCTTPSVPSQFLPKVLVLLIIFRIELDQLRS